MKTNLLEATIEDIENTGNNSIDGYYPFSTKDNNDNKVFSFKEIIGLFISDILNKELDSFDENSFKEKCLQQFEDLINDSSYNNVIEETYFSENRLTLDSLLVYQTYKASQKSKKIFEIFKQLNRKKDLNINFESNVNFIERIILDELKSNLKSKPSKSTSSSYLTFLEPLFSKDLKFISKNKRYFTQNIEKFFELYLFIYCSQLALNLKPNINALEEPKARDLYFILNHEKVSVERKKIMDNGYSNLYERAKYIFPYLSLLRVLSIISKNNDLRLYDLVKKFDKNTSNTEMIDAFNIKFRKAKKLNSSFLKSDSTVKALDSLLNSAYEQFRDNFNKRNALDKYIKAFEKQVAKAFLQTRGRAGKILVLDQDTIVLLTNIAIGDKKKLRFQDLLKELKERGICFDSKSQNELLELFERIGNIERKSDSGDAVYVKTTI
jgi:DNA phosphorothioation-dependent restriction protein DptG